MHFQPGDEIQGKYRVQRLLGKGGQAEVYLVTHLSLGVERAIKVISREMVGVGSQVFADFRRRFAQEAKLGAGLKDARLVHVYDLLESPELAILEMDYVPGGSLAELIAAAKQQGRALPLERCLAIGADMAAALASLHAMDIVHRDLKPANVLLDSQGRANVGDLGLAQSPWGDSRRSLLGEDAPRHPGTPAYMSPEQDSDRGHLLPSSDCYAWAALLFELLTLRLWRNVPPGIRASTLRDDVPPWLDELLDHCLLENPRERPWDGTALQQALEDGLHEEGARRRQASEAEAQARRKVEAEAAAVKKRAEEARRQEAMVAEERSQPEARPKAEEEAAAAMRRANAASEKAERAEAERRMEAELYAAAGRARRVAEDLFKLEEEERQKADHPKRRQAGPSMVSVLALLLVLGLTIFFGLRLLTALIGDGVGSHGTEGGWSEGEEPGRSIPIDTPPSPTPTRTPTATATVAAPSSDPVADVRRYWSLLESGESRSAWNLLTQGFKDRNHNGNIEHYIAGWSRQARPQFISGEVQQQANGQATVEALVRFTGRSGSTTDQLITHNLVEGSDGIWRIDRVPQVRAP